MEALLQANPASRAVLKQIKVKEQKLSEAKLIQEKFSLSEITSRVLSARGFVTDKTLDTFLDPTLQSGLIPPENLKGLDQTISIISDGVKTGKKFAIACDFDVDGLSGGSQILDALRKLGAVVQSFVPCRFSEGYGLHAHKIQEIAESGFNILITVDFGTTNQKEIALAKSLGLTVIIIDHHHITGEIPCADAFINPHQTGCGFKGQNLSAAGLVWYLIVALKKVYPEIIDPKICEDLASLGTICDMVPLVGINRVIAKRGLEVASRTDRVGLKFLKSIMGVKRDLTCSDISFGIGPRINAAGRMVHGEIVLDLLTTEDSDLAQEIAQKLDKLNKERQETEEKVRETALKRLRKFGVNYSVVVADPEFHTGVLGIVAQRLAEQFYRPTVVLGQDEGDIFKGSVRGIKGISVIELLKSVSATLIKFGGHDGAGGLSIYKNKLDDFAAEFEAACAKALSSEELTPTIWADTEGSFSEISLKVVSEFYKFSPCGMNNPYPQIYIPKVKILSTKELKGTHLKAVMSDGKRTYQGIMWRQPSHPLLKSGATVDLVVRPDRNSYNGFDEVQFTILAVNAA